MASFLTKFKQDFLEDKAEHFSQKPGRDGEGRGWSRDKTFTDKVLLFHIFLKQHQVELLRYTMISERVDVFQKCPG